MNESSVEKNINANNRSTIKPPPNFIGCKNPDTDRIQNMEIESNSLFLFQVNFCSLSKNFEDPEYLLKGTSKYFDVIVISE